VTERAKRNENNYWCCCYDRNCCPFW